VISTRSRVVGALAIAAIAVSSGACTSSSSTAAASVKPVASIAADQLVVPETLTICSDLPYPPQEMFDEQGNVVGSDIEIGKGIADRLGLKFAVQNTVFDTIIQALSSGKCDMIISAMTITTDRAAQIDFIPYFNAGQSFVVLKGNPSNIKSTDDLCGKTVAAESGTTEDQSLRGTDAYQGKGLSDACVAAGKSAITIVDFQHDSDALLALQTNKADAYFTDSPVAGYQVTQHPDQFELVAGLLLDVANEGIGLPNDDAHAGLRASVKTALQAMLDDGSYMKALKDFGVESGAVSSLG
jgi:polar amino acid transport system substrate-binding protein